MLGNKTAVFIDTNIYLKFYYYSHSDLNVLQKLDSCLKEKQFNLYVTEQVIDEFDRKRAKTIKDALKKLSELYSSNSIPTLCQSFEKRYAKLGKCKREYEDICRSMYDDIKDKAIKFELESDIIINSIFECAKTIERNNEIIKNAKKRNILGNPPGKGSKIGDAINWESLLAEVNENTKLIIVSNDSDFCDELDKKRLHAFLQKEWGKVKKSEVILYDNLNLFFKDFLPGLKLKDRTNEEINSLISKLETSLNFQATHSIIKELNDYIELLTNDQANKIINACMNNNQVLLIVNDSDVKEFVKSILSNHEDLERIQELQQQID